MTIEEPKQDSAEQRWWPLICALAGALFFAAAWPSLAARGLWIDEMRTSYATIAHDALRISVFRYIVLNDPAGPLHTLLTAGFCSVAGNSDAMLRLPSLAFMSLCVCVFGMLARRFLAQGASFAAMLLFAFSMNTLYFAQEARPYAMLLFWSLLSYLLATLEPDNPRRRAGLFALAFILGMYTHIVFAFVIANCVLHEWLVDRNAPGAGDSGARPASLALLWQRLPATAGAAAAALAYLPWFIVLLTRSADPSRTPDVMHSLGKTALVAFSGLFTGNAYAPMKFMAMASAAAMILWLYGLGRFPVRARCGRRTLVLWTAAPMILAFAAFALFRGVYNFFHFRYLLPVFPMLILAMGAGLGAFVQDNAVNLLRRRGEPLPERIADLWLRPSALPKFLYVFVFMVFLFGNVMNIGRYGRTPLQDWRGAYDFISQNARPPHDTILVYGIAAPMISYYANREGIAGKRVFTLKSADKVRDIYDAFASTENARLIFYEDRWRTELNPVQHKWFAPLCRNKTVLPGRFGDITICSSTNPVLFDTLSLCFGHDPRRSDQTWGSHCGAKETGCLKFLCAGKACRAGFDNPASGPVSIAVTQPLPAELSFRARRGAADFSFHAGHNAYLTTALAAGAFDLALDPAAGAFEPFCVDLIRRGGMALPGPADEAPQSAEWIRK